MLTQEEQIKYNIKYKDKTPLFEFFFEWKVYRYTWSQLFSYAFGYWHPMSKEWFGGRVFNRKRYV